MGETVISLQPERTYRCAVVSGEVVHQRTLEQFIVFHNQKLKTPGVCALKKPNALLRALSQLQIDYSHCYVFHTAKRTGNPFVLCRPCFSRCRTTFVSPTSVTDEGTAKGVFGSLIDGTVDVNCLEADKSQVMAGWPFSE